MLSGRFSGWQLSFARGKAGGDNLTGWPVRLAFALAAIVFAFALWTSGVIRGAEDGAKAVFFATQSNQASGQLHVVEIDAASLAKIDRWPWPRRHYASLVQRLSDAGARSITFDVDFSAPSDPEDDARFAAALSRSKTTVALPTFAQQARSQGGRVLDSLPIPALRENAILASVSVAPDGDGVVRRMPLGTMTDGVPRPTLSAHISGRPGTAGRDFPLDLSIDPQSIPRHSFVDVETGRFRPDGFRGKDVLVGATAIELGDRYAVPGFGVIPGVIVQALAAETLYDAVPVSGGPWWLLAGSLAFLLWIASARKRQAAVARGAWGVAALAAANFSLWSGFSILVEIVPAITAICAATAFTAIRLYSAEMQQQRLHDSQTGLPNRLAMEAGGCSPDHVTVAAVIGGFEALHSVLGEKQTADLVRRISERLSIGNGGQTVYRLEDRVLSWSSEAQGLDLEHTLSGLSALMRSPFDVGGRPIDVQIAFGIAGPGALADAAHSGSEAHRNGERWHYHAEAENAALEQRVSLMGELDNAIAQRQIEVLYQPKLRLSTNQIGSVEALVRWRHPERGYLRPDTFIPMAEESDRICDLTLYVLERTIEDLAIWCERGLVLTAAVNISARLVASEEFLAKAEAVLMKTGIPRQRLIFEVTESATITNPAAAIAALQHFRDLGVAISMDDYGTGQSTLTYLKQLPLSELKIDRSFVQFAHRDKNDALLVRSTIELAHELGLTVVAEGVEEDDCLHFLREIGCDYAQGYLIGKPMTADALLNQQNAEQSLAA